MAESPCSVAAALKRDGNAAVSAGKFDDAIALYSKGLQALVEYIPSSWCSGVVAGAEESPTPSASSIPADIRSEIEGLLSNRCAVYLRIGQFAAAESDGTRVLALSPDHVKALYRRAQARNSLFNYLGALSDCQKLLRLTPGNAEAVALAQRLQRALRDDGEAAGGYSVHAVVDAVKGDADVDVGKVCVLLDSLAANSNTNSSATSLATSGIIQRLVERTIVDMQRVAGPLGRFCSGFVRGQAATVVGEMASDMAADFAHAADSIITAVSVPLTDAGMSVNHRDACVAACGLLEVALAASCSHGEPLPATVSSALTHAINWVLTHVGFAVAKCNSTAGLSDCVKALSSLLHGVGSREEVARSFVSTGLVQQVITAAYSQQQSEPQSLHHDSKSSCGTAAVSSEAGADLHRVCNGLLASTLRAASTSPAKPSPASRSSQQTYASASATPAITAAVDMLVSAWRAEMRARYDDICGVHGGGSAAYTIDSSFDAAPACMLAVANMVFLVNQAAAESFAGQQEVLLSAFYASGSSNPQHQILACDFLTNLAASEATRGLLPAFAEDVQAKAAIPGWEAKLSVAALYERLLDAASHRVRAAAIVAVAKLSGGSQAFSLVSKGEKALTADEKANKSAAADKLTLTILAILEDEIPLPEDGAAGRAGDPIDTTAVAKVIEAVATISTHTRAKRTLANPQYLRRLVRAGQSLIKLLESGGGAGEVRPAMFGLLFTLTNLCISRSRQRAEKLAEMEIDVKQYKQLQSLALPGTSQDAIADDEDEDPVSDVEERVRTLLSCEKLVQLVCHAEKALRLSSMDAASYSQPSRAIIAQLLLNLSEHTFARGAMVASGCVSTLLSLIVGPAMLDKAQRYAATQSLCRILISTNPTLIPGELLMDAIPPIIEVIRDSGGALQQFEALMAITNVLSASDEARDLALHSGVIGACEVCQFTENKMLRRAATEALTNLATTEMGVKLIGQARLPVWLALAGDWERGTDAGAKSDDSSTADTATATAALGALAMVALCLQGDEEDGLNRFANAFAFADGHRTAGEILLSGKLDLIHRCLVICDTISRTPVGAASLLCSLDDATPEITVCSLLQLLSENKWPSLAAPEAAKKPSSGGALSSQLTGLAAAAVCNIANWASQREKIAGACTVTDPDVTVEGGAVKVLAPQLGNPAEWKRLHTHLLKQQLKS